MTTHHMPGRMADDLRKEHAERLQAARDEEEASKLELLDAHMGDDYSHAIARLIDAKVELALLERSS